VRIPDDADQRSGLDHLFRAMSISDSGVIPISLISIAEE